MFKNILLKATCILSLFVLFVNFDSYNVSNFSSKLYSETFLEAKGVKVEVKAFNSEESKKIFSKDILDKGYQPLQLTIHNDTGDSYSICASSVDLKSTKAKEVFKKVLTSTFPRKAVYSIIGLFFWPMIIPSAIDSAVTHKLRKYYEKDFMAKTIKDEVIAPYSTISRVIFIPKEEMKTSFDVTLIELDSLKPFVYKCQMDEAIG